MNMVTDTQKVDSAKSLCLSLIIPVRNRKSFTQFILGQLTQQIAAQSKRHHVQIIVVDDGSSDGTAEMITEAFPKVKFIKGDGDLWWTGAISVGMEYAIQKIKADYLVWLNDDISVSDDFIAQLIAQCLDTLGSKVITGGIICDRNHPNWIVFGGVIASQPINDIKLFDSDAILNVDTLNGNIALMPAQLVHDIGLPDAERFRHYGGDYEYMCRAKVAGYTICLSSFLRGSTDYQPADVIRYMPLWIQWYISKTYDQKRSVLQSLSNRRSPYNVKHMVNSIYRQHNHVPRWKYHLFHTKKLIKLVGSDFIPRSIRRKRVEAYFNRLNVPTDIAQAVLK